MDICKGWSKRPLRLSVQEQYCPEQLMSRVMPSDAAPASPLVCQPVWIRLEGRCVRLHSKEEIELACRLVCIHLNATKEEEVCPYTSGSESEEDDASE